MLPKKPNKIIINLSTITVGGAIQVAISFIENVSKQNPRRFVFLLPEKMLGQLEQKTIKKLSIYTFKKSPAKSPSTQHKIRKIILQIKPKLIFTLFGPAYVNFNCPHICGMANGWITHAKREHFHLIKSLKKRLTMKLLTFYKQKHYKHANYWHTESQIAKRGAVERFKIDPDRITVIPNEVGSFYLPYLDEPALKTNLKEKAQINALCFGSAYVHKNLAIIIPTLLELKKRGINNIHFHVTLPKKNPIYIDLLASAQKNQLENHIHNHGPIPVAQGPELYKKMDLLFFPTLLESYSVTPLEAMTMGIPALISNIPAHTDLFDEEVFFFDPLSPQNIADTFEQMLNDPDEIFRRQNLAKTWVQNKVNNEPSRFELYMGLIEKVLEETA